MRLTKGTNSTTFPEAFDFGEAITIFPSGFYLNRKDDGIVIRPYTTDTRNNRTEHQAVYLSKRHALELCKKMQDELKKEPQE